MSPRKTPQKNHRRTVKKSAAAKGRQRRQPTNQQTDVLGDAVKLDRGELAKVITFLESTRPDDHVPQLKLLSKLLARGVPSWRIGVTGVPGAGKSTLIDALGIEFVRRGKRVAVLAIDPSSSLTGGSILGDKTRMERLARSEHSFIRPSPSAGLLGGISLHTREAVVAVEAAGYDVVIIETVGVGQSEIAVRDLVDVCVLLTLTGAGDELQGMKRGILELCDVLVVNKADGDNQARAEILARDLARSLRMFGAYLPGWEAPALACSAITGAGIEELADAVERCVSYERASGAFEKARAQQDLRWFEERVFSALKSRLFRDASRKSRYQRLRAEVEQGRRSVPETVEEVVAELLKR